MVRRIACSVCQASWPARAARFCGRCGAPLSAAADGSGAGRPRSRLRRSLAGKGRIGVAIGLAVTVLAGVTLAAMTSRVEHAADGGEDGEVDLPGRPAGDTGDTGPSGPEAPLGAPASFGCEPVGCALWEARIGDGTYTVADGLVFQATTVGVRAVDPTTGRTRWRITYVHDDLPPLLEAVEIQILDDEVAVTSEGGLIQVRALETGELRWHAALPVERVTAVAAHGEVVVAVGLPRAGEEQPPVAIAAYDRSTGATRWEGALHRAVTIDTDPLVLQPRTLVVTAVDPATGDVVWTREVIGPVRGLVGDGALALVSPGGVDLLDPQTGEKLRTVPRRVSDTGVTRLAGGLLLVDAPSGPDPHATPRSDMTVATVEDPQQPTWRVPGTTGVVEAGDGVVVASHDDDVLTVQRLTADGRVPWTRSSALTEPTCCWTLQPGPDTTTVLVVPPEPGRHPVEILDLDEGRPVSTFSVPTRQVRNTLAWTGGIGAESGGDRTTLTGHGGTVRLAAEADVVATEPVPIVRVPGGLMGLHRDGLIPRLEPR